MSVTAVRLPSFTLAPPARQEAMAWAAGLAVTFGLFLMLAWIENATGSVRQPMIADLPVVTVPFDTPPPPQSSEPPPPDEAPPPLTGIEAGPADSPVKIAVMPPDLAALLSQQRIPPRATVSLRLLAADLKPGANVGVDLRHVYQQSEVDRRPRAVVRVAPPGSAAFLKGETSLTVKLLVLIDIDGRAESARLLQSSGRAEFDALVAETVKDGWRFTAAVKAGRKVRCLVEQDVTIAVSADQSPFSAQ